MRRRDTSNARSLSLVAGDEVVVEVLAAALHPRVRSQANGSHYTSTGRLPLVPGIDAVVRDPKVASAMRCSPTAPSEPSPSAP
jgi:NADPH:quinone reductase-like Zn-dependent oxidoreductase